MRVRLTRKLAEEVDGVDLRRHSVGDVLEVPAVTARLLIAEGWAVPERGRDERPHPERVASSLRHDE